ncbi:MAG: hypothetical protein PWR01_3684 [Clostridiales bacterium]|jgi:hypothetical protein|nr:hypothetical protein [Clostridiales bacterium]MDN5282611.1 hypothetical protein [Candidatus Ozemobacter sp.]
MLKKIKFIFLVLLVVMSVPCFAFDGANLSKAMNSAAYAGEYLNHLTHPGMPKPWTNPMFMEMSNKLSDAWKVIKTEVATIETEKEIELCKAVIENFKQLKGTYRDLGYQVEISLNERIKFLEAHNSI